MTPDTATPATTTPSAEPDMMALALAADRGETLPEPAPEQTPTPTPAAGTTDKAAETAETATPEAKPESETTTPPAKPESAFEKAKKDKARQQITWEKINAEKQELANQRAKLQRDAEELARMANTVRTPPSPPPAAPSQYSPDQYEQAADRLDSDGKYELAEAARAEAKRLRAQPPPAAQQPQAMRQAQPAQPAPMVPGSPQFMKVWQQATQELTKLDPELSKPDSPIYKATAEALRAHPELNQRPNGIAYAYHFAMKKVADGMAGELAKAKAELERLNKHSALRGSPPGALTTTPRSIDQMTPAEADAYVLAQAQAADRGE